jgi:hypothetical protein
MSMIKLHTTSIRLQRQILTHGVSKHRLFGPYRTAMIYTRHN